MAFVQAAKQSYCVRLPKLKRSKYRKSLLTAGGKSDSLSGEVNLSANLKTKSKRPYHWAGSGSAFPSLQPMRKALKKAAVVAGSALMAGSAMAADPTDIAGVITSVDGYRTAAVAVGVAVLLFVLGRSIVRKLAK